MSINVSNRHESDLGGTFLPFSDARSVGITVAVTPSEAGIPSVQHTAWMLVNMLSRCEGIVHRLSLQCPHGIALAGRIVPLAPRDVDLRTALILGATTIGVTRIEEDIVLERTLVVGSGSGLSGHMFVSGAGWRGGFSDKPFELSPNISSSALPFGPYIAACLAVGEVFKAARMSIGTYQPLPSVFYSAWDHGVSTTSVDAGNTPASENCAPSTIDLNLEAAIAGVGAVGCAAIHALWACPGLQGTIEIIDNDPEGLEASNLNRYVLFGSDSIRAKKPSEAARVVDDSPIDWLAHEAGVEQLVFKSPRVISAVDRNSARAAIQSRYYARVFSASTRDLRAEILRCGPPGKGACLRCNNPPEKIIPDEEIRKRIQAASDEEVVRWAESVGVTLNEAKEWAATGRCGLPGERLLPVLRVEADDPAFAVAFVSVMAGTLVAAELLKDYLDDVNSLSEVRQKATFQFFAPTARSNRSTFYGRDPKCPLCAPNIPAFAKWLERYENLSSHRA